MLLVLKKNKCILHVKKRMFKRASEAKKRLRQLKKRKNNLNVKTKHKVRHSTESAPKAAQLTIKVMKDLSTYYGLAIHRNPNSIEKMRHAILATYHHKISNETSQHSLCPPGAESWCKRRKHEVTGSLASDQHPPALDGEVQQMLKPFDEDLTSDDLLERCLGSNTQNNNEF